jgi:hypothetical protein
LLLKCRIGGAAADTFGLPDWAGVTAGQVEACRMLRMN